jgi:steroid delta-isomerase-like uncharacterized protein
VRVTNGSAAEANVEVVREAVTALNEQDAERLLAVVAPDLVIHYAELPEPLVGRDTWLHGFEIMRTAFPDFRVHIDDVVAAGDRVALRVHIVGTHSGEFQGAPATGRRISYVSHEFYRLDGGVVAEEWICSDVASLFRQLQ